MPPPAPKSPLAHTLLLACSALLSPHYQCGLGPSPVVLQHIKLWSPKGTDEVSMQSRVQDTTTRALGLPQPRSVYTCTWPTTLLAPGLPQHIYCFAKCGRGSATGERWTSGERWTAEPSCGLCHTLCHQNPLSSNQNPSFLFTMMTLCISEQ